MQIKYDIRSELIFSNLNEIIKRAGTILPEKAKTKWNSLEIGNQHKNEHDDEKPRRNGQT